MKLPSTVAQMVLSSLVIFTSCGFKQETKSVQDPPIESLLANGNARKIQLPFDSLRLKQIRVDSVTQQTIATEDTVTSATVDLYPGRSAQVILPAAGRIVGIPVRIGDFVSRGQPVLYLQSRDAEAALDEYAAASAALAQAGTEQSGDEAVFERALALLRDHSSTKQDLLAAEAQLRQAEATVAQAEIASIEARARLDLLGLNVSQPRNRITVRSPIAGNVVEASAKAGEFRNDPNKTVFTIADLTLLRVAFVLSEGQARLIKLGEALPVELTPFPNRPLRAIVTQVGNVGEPATQTVKVFAKLANPQGDIRPGMNGRIRLAGRPRVIVAVPSTALIRTSDRAYVFRQTGPGRFEPVPVEIERCREGIVCISKGLRPADRVVVDGLLHLWKE